MAQFRKVFSNVSIHGVQQFGLNIKRSDRVLAAWGFVVLVACSLIAYQLTCLSQLLLTYPSAVVVMVITFFST